MEGFSLVIRIVKSKAFTGKTAPAEGMVKRGFFYNIAFPIRAGPQASPD